MILDHTSSFIQGWNCVEEDAEGDTDDDEGVTGALDEMVISSTSQSISASTSYGQDPHQHKRTRSNTLSPRKVNFRFLYHRE